MNTTNKTPESKLTLKREKLVLLGTRTGIKTGLIPPTYLCGEPKTFICYRQP